MPRHVQSFRSAVGASGECTRQTRTEAAADRCFSPILSPVSLYTLGEAHELIEPVLVAAFDGWVDAGLGGHDRAGASSPTTAAVVATFDAGRAVRLSSPASTARDRRRPPDRADLARADPAPDAPRRARPPRPRRAGARLPLARVHRRRRSSSPRRLGVVEWISLGAIPAAVPHTRQVPILGTEARPGCCAARSRPGRPGRCVCPSALVSALEHRGRDGRDPGARLLRAGPALRVRAVRDRGAGAARTLGRHLGTEIPARRARRRRHASCATGSTPRPARDETTRGYVERLEAMYDEQRLPSGDDLISDIERFLRDQGSRREHAAQ